MKPKIMISICVSLLSVVPTLEVAAQNRANLAQTLSQQAPHLQDSGVYPTNTGFQDATHFIEVEVEGHALSQLILNIPPHLTVNNGIEVTSDSQQPIDAQVRFENDHVAILDFAQPVPPETTLRIEIQDVESLAFNAEVWHYRVLGQFVGINELIPLGVARVKTYD